MSTNDVFNNVQRGFIYNSQKLATAQNPLSRKTNKNMVVCLYSGIILRSKSLINLIWMTLKSIMLNEGSLKQKNTNFAFLFI